jgi:hypothetical protein
MIATKNWRSSEYSKLPEVAPEEQSLLHLLHPLMSLNSGGPQPLTLFIVHLTRVRTFQNTYQWRASILNCGGR